jgi:hypothetical protein
MPKYTVQQGDSIPSIAEDNGFFWETIWNHGENAQLKAKRKTPNQLFPGDEVFVPELRKRIESRPTDARHTFKKKGAPAKIRVRLLMLNEPRKNEPYVLDIDGKQIKGTTDGDGKIEQFMPPNARSAKVILKGGKEIINLRIGHLDPIEEISGVQQRLNNLGFNAGSEDGELDDQTRSALRAFQARYGLEASGEVDESTRAKLKAMHE